MIRRASLLLIVGLMGACARSPILPMDELQIPVRAELDEVAFFPQQDYQCGPAALATLLTQRGVDTTPEQLVDSVYLPGRQGSLQVEMVAAARTHGLLVYPLAPRLQSVLTEVAAGNPVLVLQNLAFDRWPQWHFAVVVGYDLEKQTLVLRSGTTRRSIETFRQFERSWSKGERWAVVAVDPQAPPATAELTPWLKAASDLEQIGQKEAAQAAYRVAGDRWDSELPWFALANSQYDAGDLFAAERSLRNSLQHNAGFAVGWFNLSQVLAERECSTQAQAARRCAARLAPDDSRFSVPLPAAGDQGQCQAPPVCAVP